MYTFTLEPEQVDNVVVDSLKENLESLKQDFRMRQNGEIQYGIFDNEVETDLFKLEEHVKAFNMILAYFGGESTQF